MAKSYRPSYQHADVTIKIPQAVDPIAATVHYVEAGDPTNPNLLLLHGFPSSSRQFRDLIPLLSGNYHVLAPDYPGYGLSTAAENFTYNFENVTSVVGAWLKQLNIHEAAVYVFDFGAPVAFRLALTGGLPHVTAIISQNGNCYDEGIGAAIFQIIRDLWKTNSPEARAVVADKMISLDGARNRYVVGTPDADQHLIDPTTWTIDYLQNLAGSENQPRQLDMLYDYRKNVELYPECQKWIRESGVPILAVWGKNDVAFIPPGAEAFKKDCPAAEIHLLDAGHFALETKRWEIAELMNEFLDRVVKRKGVK